MRAKFGGVGGRGIAQRPCSPVIMRQTSAGGNGHTCSHPPSMRHTCVADGTVPLHAVPHSRGPVPHHERRSPRSIQQLGHRHLPAGTCKRYQQPASGMSSQHSLPHRICAIGQPRLQQEKAASHETYMPGLWAFIVSGRLTWAVHLVARPSCSWDSCLAESPGCRCCSSKQAAW